MQHRQVCLFPSKHFYDGSLVSAPVTRTEYLKFCSQFPNIENFWPVGKEWPTVFYNVQGKESHPSSTEKVRLQSLCNHSEAKKIVSSFKSAGVFFLISRMHSTCYIYNMVVSLHVHAHKDVDINSL